MNPGVANVLKLPFVQITLPVLIGMWVMNRSWNKHRDAAIRQLDKRFDEIDRRPG